MGTRSTTKIYENERLLLSLYKQYDGYPEGWGQELKDFFRKGVFVNGFNGSKGELEFNGVGDFALLLVKEFKEGTGRLYATTENDKQEYNYVVEFDYPENDYSRMRYSISCKECPEYLEEGWIEIQ
jgi:hypothetical protein